VKCLVTGGAGFIGSSLIDRLLALGEEVVCFDNLDTGLIQFLSVARENKRFTLVTGDTLDMTALRGAMSGCDIVFHLAANADVRFGSQHPRKDLEQNTIATYNVLSCMKDAGVKRIAFSSTGSVYGEATVIPTPEDAPFPVQTSLYGASKLACEGLIAAFCEAYDFQSWIFRFVSILGERYTHGHVFDFYRQLSEDSGKLAVLGDGTQKKSYLYIQDCIDAILLAIRKAQGKVSIFNLGTNEYVELKDSIRVITEELGVKPALSFAGGSRGWIGDNPFILLACSRIRALGWAPKFSIKEGIIRTVRFLKANDWVFAARETPAWS
jgi:UDP-glucose 4-epimerase